MFNQLFQPIAKPVKPRPKFFYVTEELPVDKMFTAVGTETENKALCYAVIAAYPDGTFIASQCLPSEIVYLN